MAEPQSETRNDSYTDKGAPPVATDVEALSDGIVLKKQSLDEFRHNWRILAGVVVGLSAGVTSTLGYSFGALVEPLESEFGWSRAQLSLGLTMFTLAIFVTGPMWGALADRWGARRVAAFSLLVYGIVLFSFPTLLTLAPFWLLYFCAGAVGCGAAAVTLVKPVTITFSAARGIALGIALSSVGFAAFWAPLFTAWLVKNGDWALGYKGIAIIALAAAPIVWMLLPPAVRTAQAASDQTCQESMYGLTFSQALKTSDFWLLLFIGCTITIGLAGASTHLIPIFRELGAAPSKAAAIASILGISSVAGRLLVGFALDRVNGPVMAVVVSAMATVGILFLHAGIIAGPFAVLLIGLAFGSEVDITAYFASRYFGRRAFSTIYGWLFGAFAIGGGGGSLLSGALFDSTGNYQAAIITCAVMSSIAGILSLKLGPYRYAASH